MSWGFEYVGTPAAVKAAVTKYAEDVAKGYEGKPEADDIRTCRDRVLALVDALEIEGPINGVIAKASGSHSWNGRDASKIMSASFQLSVTRTSLVL